MRCMDQPPPEKPWPNEPKPPRLTLLWLTLDDVLDEEWLEESLLKKLDRDELPPLPLPPPDELLLLVQVVVCPGTAPGAGSQFCRGIKV